ncbi:hypothetical protein HPB52_009958 [Rhipicephalus sanguineus]|uniref:RRM domain-containing protein n=1 Tax=Rhipicephalus sanguineus TaxID=34632 RepID=A0A9D4PCP0_RHISA|nr:hypothetical protein HPB52_009958 [Rhipicephalus sanguineus]
MKKYFSQFGTVTNLRLSRSWKTGGSRGYAFIEFLSKDVAKIVADTMDGYLFFNKIMKCSVIPKEHVHEGLFRHFRYPFPLRKEVVRIVHNRRRTAESEKRSAHRRLATLERTKAQLRKMGVRWITYGRKVSCFYFKEDLIDHLSRKCKSMILAIDAKITFENVSHEAIFCSLEGLGCRSRIYFIMNFHTVVPI